MIFFIPISLEAYVVVPGEKYEADTYKMSR